MLTLNILMCKLCPQVLNDTFPKHTFLFNGLIQGVKVSLLSTCSWKFICHAYFLFCWSLFTISIHLHICNNSLAFIMCGYIQRMTVKHRKPTAMCIVYIEEWCISVFVLAMQHIGSQCSVFFLWYISSIHLLKLGWPQRSHDQEEISPQQLREWT